MYHIRPVQYDSIFCILLLFNFHANDINKLGQPLFRTTTPFLMRCVLVLFWIATFQTRVECYKCNPLTETSIHS